MGKCALCDKESILKNSHIIPKFVFDYIKGSSFTNRLREMSVPNLPKQDGPKEYMLCEECEQRFSKRENLFATKIFHPALVNKAESVKYQEWLYYFVASITWRYLYSELNQLAKGKEIYDIEDIDCMVYIERSFKKFLIDGINPESNIKNFLFKIDIQDLLVFSKDFKDLDPEFFLKRGVLISSFEEKGNYYVVCLICGIVLCTVYEKNITVISEQTMINKVDGVVNVELSIEHIIFSQISKWLNRNLELTNIINESVNFMNEIQNGKLASIEIIALKEFLLGIYESKDYHENLSEKQKESIKKIIRKKSGK